MYLIIQNNRSTAEVQQQVQTLVRDLQEANTQLRQVQQEKSELFERYLSLHALIGVFILI